MAKDFLSKIRSQYPQYNDLDDATLAKAYHKKHYSDLDEDVFMDKIGLHQPTITERVSKSVRETLEPILPSSTAPSAAQRRREAMGTEPTAAQTTTTPTVNPFTISQNVSEDSTTTRPFTMSTPTAQEEFNGTFTPKMLSPAEQDKQVQEQNAKTFSTQTELSDYGNMLGSGLAKIYKGAGWAVEEAGEGTGLDGLKNYGTAMRETGDESAKYWEDGLSQAALDAQKVKFVAEDQNGDISVADTLTNIVNNPATIGLMATESLPATGLGMGIGGLITKGFTLIPQVGTKVASAFGYGLGEGAVASASAGVGTEDTVLNMSHDELMQHPEYRAVYLSNGDEAKSKKIIADAAGDDAAALTFVTTTLLSAPFGYTMSHLFSPADDVAELARKNVVQEGIKDGLGEMGQEALQSGAEAVAQNYAINQHADTSRSLGDNVLESMVSGGVAGFGMGAAMGAGQSGMNNRKITQYENALEDQRDAMIQDNYNRAMLGGGMEMQLAGDPLESFTAGVDAKLNTIRSSLTNLSINHPEFSIPEEAKSDPAVAETIIAQAQEQGLNLSDNDGLNAIDVGFTKLADEMGVDIAPVANTVQEPIEQTQPIIEKPIVGEPEPEASVKDNLTVQTVSPIDQARFEELDAKPEDELTIEEQWELGDLITKIEGGVAGNDTNVATNNTAVVQDSLTTQPMEENFTGESNVGENINSDSNGDTIADSATGSSGATSESGTAVQETGVGSEAKTPTVTKKPLSARAEAIQAAGEIPVGGSEDETAAQVKTMFNTSDIDSPYKKMNATERAIADEQNDISRGNEISVHEYNNAYNFLPTAKKTQSGVQGSLGFEGTQNALFDTAASEEYVVPTWAKGIVSDTTRYEDIITALYEAKNGNPNALATRTMDALRSNGYPHLQQEINRYDELIGNFFLNEIEEQELEALAKILENYLKDNIDATPQRNTTATAEAITGDEQGTQGSNGAIQEVPSAGEYTGGSKNADAGSVPANVKIVFDVNKVYSTKGIIADYPINVLSKTIQKDVAKYVEQLAKATGLEFEIDAKGKKLSYNGVNANIPPAGGSVSFRLFKPNTEIGVYINLNFQPETITRGGGYDAYRMMDSFGGQLYRSFNGKKDYTGGSNNYIKKEELTSEKFVRAIINMVDREATKQEAKEQEAKNDTRGTRPNSTNNGGTGSTTGIPTGKQGTPNQGSSGGNDGAVPNTNQRPDRPNAPTGNRDGISPSDKPVEGYTAPSEAEPVQPEQTYADEVLPRPTQSDSTETVYSLEGKSPVELTKGQRKKFNDAALEILKKPLEEITEADREILRHYTGEGGLGEVSENSVNQHYTHYQTVESIYAALNNAGVPMNRALEPAVGSGNFVGFNPNASWDVVDIDTTNIEVVKRLYPQINSFHAETYETFKGKNYDLIISNVPFASENMLMREYAMTVKPAFKAIHNFYFAHSIDKVKDNGVVAFMTSTGTMDGTTQARALRKYLMDRGDIIGAFRLPEKSQAKNTHTDTMIDIIFIQKRPDGVESRQKDINDQFVNIVNVDGYPMNGYFAAHPESVLGEQVIAPDKTKMGKVGWVVRGEPNYSNIVLNYEPYKTNILDNLEEILTEAFEQGEIANQIGDKIYSNLGNYGSNNHPISIQDIEVKVTKTKVHILKRNTNVILATISMEDIDDKKLYWDMSVLIYNKLHTPIFANVDEARSYTNKRYYGEKVNIFFTVVDEIKPHMVIEDDKVIYFDTPVAFTDTDAKAMFGKELRGDNAQKILLLNSIMTLTEQGVSNGDAGLMNSAVEKIKQYQETFDKSPHNDLAFKKFMKDHRADLKLKEYMSYFDKDFNPAAVYGEQTRFKDSGRLEINADSPLMERALYYADADGVLNLDEEYEHLSEQEMLDMVASRAFVDSSAGSIQLDFMYYAGNVYQKIDLLERMHDGKLISDKHYQEQHDKLRSILPPYIPFANITVRGDESWLPEAVRDKIVLSYEKITNVQHGDTFKKYSKINNNIRPPVFNGDMSKCEVYQRYLDKTALAPKKKDESDQENVERTMEANRFLVEVLIPEVMSYIEKEGLSDMLVEAYNRHANFYVAPEMTGRLLRELPKSFRGKPFKMQSHQLQGAEKLVYNKKGVLAFAPGGGKTVTAIVAAMNLIQQGVMKKPIFVVPVNTIAQWENSVRELYPNAKVFEFPKVKSGINKGNAKEWTQLSREEKEQMAYDLANNRYDFTIIGDTMFQKFALPSATLSEYVDDLVEQIQSEEESDEDGNTEDKKGAVSAESKRRALKRGLKDIYGGDVEFDFAKMGFDAIIADEVQYYKNIGYGGKDAKGGLGTSIDISYFDREGKALKSKDIKEGAEPYSATLGSMRSYDFRFKTKYISRMNNGNNVILLTGTPTPNKPLELYTLLQHLDESILGEYGIDTSADFVNTFYDIESYETTDSKGDVVKREGLSSMKNLDWMGNILSRYVDYKGFVDMPELPRPKQVDVKHYLKLSRAGEAIFKDVQQRMKTAMEDAKKVQSGQMRAEAIEIPLVAQGAGRSASIDLRLYDVGKKGKSNFDMESLYDLIESDIQTTENNKILKTVELVTNQYKENGNSGQIIFLDRLTVKNRDGSTVSTHEEIRQKILATGLFDPKEVVFVNGGEFVNPNTGNTSKGSIKPDMLNRIMDMYNEGKIKVIIGNTSKLGVGVDLNRKTTDIYQLDIPYRPDEIEQRSNRGVRQGNENAEVRVHTFFQIGTFDKRSYDIVIAKRGFNDVYGFSENRDVSINKGSSKIDNANTTDPYQAIIDLEQDPYERERLRKQRVIDNAATDTIGVNKVVTKIENDIKTKESVRKNYEDAIKNIDENLQPKNYPKYEGVKDEEEKKAKLEKHIQGLKERRERYQGSIAETNEAIAELQGKLQERKEQITKIAADKKYITDEFTEDGTNVSIIKIKEHFSIQQILRSEGKSEAEIEEFIGGGGTHAMQIPTSIKEAIAPTVQTKEDNIAEHYARVNGYDEAGINYVPTYRVSGLPSRPSGDSITLGDRIVKLPTQEEPINADSIRVYLTDVIGNRLYEGKIQGNKNLGIYREHDASIRLKSYSDIEMMAHELAHYLDFFHKNTDKKATNSWFRREILKNKEEIKTISYTTDPKQVISEGFAEFVRLWLTNYNAAVMMAPNMVKDFEARLQDDKELNKKMLRLQEGMHQFYYQGAGTRAFQGGELNSTAKRLKWSQKQIGADARQKLIDKIHAIKRIEADVKGDVAPDAMNSPYKALQLVNGYSGVVYSAMNFGVPTVTSNGDITYSGKALNAIFEPATKHGEERVRKMADYFVARRANELMIQGRENLISQQNIDAGLAIAEEYPEFETIFDEYQAFNTAMLDFYVGMDYITEAQRDSFLENNQNYVPFHRIIESVQYGKSVTMSNIAKRLTGGTHSLGNIMENIIGGLENNIKEAMIAHGKSMFYQMLDTSGMGGVYATRVPLKSEKVTVMLNDQAKVIAQVMYAMGITLSKDGMIMAQGIADEKVYDIEEIEQILIDHPEAMEYFTHGHAPQAGSDSYIDSAIVGGTRVYFETKDAALIEAMTSFSSEHNNMAMQWLMSVKNVMTWNITNNPLFYLTNFTRDTVSASVLSKNGFIPVISSVRGMYHFVTQSQVYKDFMASGAGYGTLRATSGNQANAMRMLNVNRGLDVFNKIISGLAYSADMFEYGTRLGEFELAQKSGKSNWQAAFEGREISTDFAIKGAEKNITSFMATVPFMKAAINGIDKTARRVFSINGEMKLSNMAKFHNASGELQKHKVKIYAMGSMIALASLALFMANKDDERYKKLTRDQKLMYWNIFVGDRHIKIPKPYDIGFVFASLPEIIANGIYTKHGEEALKEFAFGVKTMFSIGDISGLFQPIMDHMTNTNWMGSPILPSNLQNVEDKADQYTDGTALMYRKIGNMTGASPILMQHYVDGYLGLTAKMIEEVTENILWDKEQWGERPFARNPVEFLTYRFQGKKEESRTYWSEKYYEISKRAEAVRNSYKLKEDKAYRDGGDALSAYVSDEEHQTLIGINDLTSDMDEQLGGLKTDLEMVTYDKALSAKEKETIINDAYKAKREALQEIVSALETELKRVEK